MAGPQTPEHRAKIAAAQTGQTLSAETRAKIAASLTGQELSDDHKRKLRLAALKRWARARGEDPDLITEADLDRIPPKQSPDYRKAHPRASGSWSPKVQATAKVEAVNPPATVTFDDGKVIVCPPDSPVYDAAGRIGLIKSLGGEPAASDWRAVDEWWAQYSEERRGARPAGPTFIDCQCFAGAFTLGATQAGFSLVHKVEEPEGFGLAMCEANRELLGDYWRGQAALPEHWEVPEGGADIMCGNPPCSGFSVMSPQSFRGVDSEINQCMRNLFAYAKRVDGLQAVIMESVPSAYKIGLTLMRELAGTFPDWQVNHVLQDNYSLGGCTRRRRYFLVVTNFELGVEPEPLKWLPTTSDAISDLRSLPLTWDMQPYIDPPTWWSLRQRTLDGQVDGHMTAALSSVNQKRLDDIISGDSQGNSVDWPPGFTYDMVLKRFYEAHSYLPESYQYQSSGKGTEHLTRDKVLIDKDFNVGGYAQTRHWPWNEPGYVITGHGPSQAWHPDGRHFTHRETARVMGFPDDWRIASLQGNRSLSAMWGKGISVDCGRWIATWVLNSMTGDPGSIRGTQLADGEDRLIDVSQFWKHVPGNAA